MRYKKTHSKVNATLLLHCLLLCSLCTSCAQKRWTETLSEDENRTMGQLVTAMQEREQLCPQSLDADMRLFWKSPVASRAVEGYLQLLAPSSMKFIVSNPLGQPVFVFSGNGKMFQILQPTKRTHIRGGVRSLAIRYQMPIVITQGDWFAYMTSRLPVDKLTVIETTQDRDNNTVWLRFADTSKEKSDNQIYLHLDQQREEVLGYLFLNKAGETLAEISYPGKKEGSTYCPVQTEVTVSELLWDSEIKIKLEDISSANQLNERDFPLPVPAGFNTQIWP
jgi:outer membrane lipoprotein-sorting protein